MFHVNIRFYVHVQFSVLSWFLLKHVLEVIYCTVIPLLCSVFLLISDWKCYNGDSCIVPVISLLMLDVVINQCLKMLSQRFIYSSGNTSVFSFLLLICAWKCCYRNLGMVLLLFLVMNQFCFYAVLVQKCCYGDPGALLTL